MEQMTRTMSQQELIDTRTAVAWDNTDDGAMLAVIRSVPEWMTLSLEHAAEQDVLNALHVGRIRPDVEGRWTAQWVIDRGSCVYEMRCVDIYEAKAVVEAGVAWVRALLLTESFYQRVGS